MLLPVEKKKNKKNIAKFRGFMVESSEVGSVCSMFVQEIERGESAIRLSGIFT